jgi:hypothetical protein
MTISSKVGYGGLLPLNNEVDFPMGAAFSRDSQAPDVSRLESRSHK